MNIINTSPAITDNEIQKKYLELPDYSVEFYCSYTTRLEGFIDIILSGEIMSSVEVARLLGAVHTHRGSKRFQEPDHGYYQQNPYISLSAGFVSFRYSNKDIQKIQEYVGGYGILIPLEKILSRKHVSFSHCSHAGGIENYQLNRSNITPALKIARKKGELRDDGYGNVFEIGIEPNDRSKDTVYPRIPITDGIIAIPKSMKESFKELVTDRQKNYRALLERFEIIKDPEEMIGLHIDGRDFYYSTLLEPTRELLRKIAEPVNLDQLPIFWYPQKNLNIAMQYVSISKALQ